MRILSAVFDDFPPFQPDGEIQFPGKPEGSNLAEVHFLVGGNGSGKTRLLSLLCAACGNRTSLTARLPAEAANANAGRLRAAVLAEADGKLAIWSDQVAFCGWLPNGSAVPSRVDMLDGKSSYSATTAGLTSEIAGLGGGGFGGATSPPEALPKIRFAMAFSGTSVMNDETVEALKPVSQGKKGEHLVLQSPDPDSRRAVAQSLVNLKMIAAMDGMQPGRKMSRSALMVTRLEETISTITGRAFSLTVSHNLKVSLKVIWGNETPLLMAQVPDGLRAILGWLAAAVARLNSEFPDDPDPLSLPVIILIDEPEAHLHPQWQRHVLPAMQRLLPNAQIIAVTHSAFVISSVNEGWIHILRNDENGRICIEEPVPCGKGDSHLDVVEDILGVTQWYDPETEAELARFRDLRDAVLTGKTDSQQELNSLASSIASRSEGLSNIMGREMAKVTRHLQKASTP